MPWDPEELERAKAFADPAITSRMKPSAKNSRKPADLTKSFQEEKSLLGGTLRKEGRGPWKKKR